MATVQQLPIDAIPFGSGVEGFTYPDPPTAPPLASQVSDSTGQTSHIFAEPGDAERLRVTDLVPAFPLLNPLIHSIRVDAVVRDNGGGAQFKLRIGDAAVSAGSAGLDVWDDPAFGVGQVQGITGLTHLVDWNGDDWTDTVVDSMHIWAELENIDAPDLQLFTLRVWATLIYEPWGTIDYPYGGVAGVALNPLVRWTYQGDGEPQYQYHLKIWTNDTYTDPGFDPEVDPGDAYDSGAIMSSASQHQVPFMALSPNETYGIGIKWAKNVNIMGRTGADPLWGQWTLGSFTCNARPVTTAIEPAVPVTTTRRPELIWEYFDNEGQPPSRQYVRVWDHDTYLEPDFDPWTTTPLRDYVLDPATPEGSPNTFKHQVDVPLPNGGYVWGARATSSTDEVSSEWHLIGLIIDTDFAEPDMPLMTLTPEPDLGRVKIEIQQAPTGIDAQWVSAARSYDDFASAYAADEIEWVRDFGWYTQDAYAGGVATLYDYEVHPNKITNFGGLLWADTTDLPEPSPAKVLSIILQTHRTWLKDPLNPELNMSFPVEESWLSRDRNKSRSVRRPLGRSLPVVRKGISEGETFTATFVILGIERREAIEALIGSNNTLLFQTARKQWYAEVMALNIQEHLWGDLRGDSDGPAWKYIVTFQEVSRP